MQAAYERLAHGAEVAIEYGEQHEGEAEAAMKTLFPAEALISELPHTTLKSSLGTDDHELRRRNLSAVVTWAEPGSEDARLCGPVEIMWRDGYETTVATMGTAIEGEHGCWMLEINDPAPGRSATLVLLRAPGENPSDAARRSLDAAIEWANLELGDSYVVQRVQEPR